MCEAAFEGTTKAFKTENTYNYMVHGPILSNQRNIMEGVKFNVDATHEKWPEGGTDIHISLSKNNPIDADSSYEIVLGGWGGTQSVIRSHHQQRPPLVELKHSREEFMKVRIYKFSKTVFNYIPHNMRLILIIFANSYFLEIVYVKNHIIDQLNRL